MERKWCNCGKEIPEARLRAVPETTRCIDCQKVHEKTHPSRLTERAYSAMAVSSDLTLHELFSR